MTRLRMPLKPRGAHALKWSRWQEKSRQIVQRRANFKCEACGSNLRPLEWAHIAGRSSLTAEPWASSPELTMGLCTAGYEGLGCHQKVDRALDIPLRDMLRWRAVQALMDRYGLGWLRGDVGDEPLDVIREAVRRLEEEWVYDPASNEIVRALLRLIRRMEDADDDTGAAATNN